MAVRHIEKFVYLLLIVGARAFPQSPTSENVREMKLIPQEITNNDREVHKESLSSPQMEISEIQLDNQALQNILQLNAEISQQSEVQSSTSVRMGRDMPVESDSALSQADIKQMIKMISFPEENVQFKKAKPRALIEPNITNTDRNNRALKHAYFVFAVADVDDGDAATTTKLRKLHIIPADSTMLGNNMPMGRDAGEEEGRIFKMKTLNKYVRRFMRMIRKGTWKVTKATLFRSSEPEKQPITKTPNFAGLYFKEAMELKPFKLQ